MCQVSERMLKEFHQSKLTSEEFSKQNGIDHNELVFCVLCERFAEEPECIERLKEIFERRSR